MGIQGTYVAVSENPLTSSLPGIFYKEYMIKKGNSFNSHSQNLNTLIRYIRVLDVTCCQLYVPLNFSVHGELKLTTSTTTTINIFVNPLYHHTETKNQNQNTETKKMFSIWCKSDANY